MPSGETHGYDLVFQIGEPALQNLLGTFFTDNLIPCRLVPAYNALVAGDLGPCFVFKVVVDFDRPGNLPAGDANAVDVTLLTGPLADGTGPVGTRTRLVVGLDVNQAAAHFDIVTLDLVNKLFLSSAAVTVQPPGLPPVTTNLPQAQVEQILRSNIPPLALFPVPVTRDTTDCKLVKSVDVALVDDQGALDLDTIVIGLTCGGGNAGDLTQFTGATIPPGNDGLLGISLDWLCRCLSERIASELGISAGDFQDCRLQRSVEIDPDEDVDLTELTLTLSPPRTIAVVAKVKKSGFCYSATGTVTAEIELEIENDELRLEPTVHPPDIDVDIPVLCWIAAAILVAVTGVLAGWLISVVIGVIAAIIAGIIVFILWVLTQVAKGVVDGVANAVKQALASAVPDIEVPLLGMDIVQENITIDDIGIGLAIVPVSTYGIRSEGELYVANGNAVDLDSGSVGSPTLIGGDLLWSGTASSRTLSTLCDTAAARSLGSRFDTFSRYLLGTLAYSSPATIRLDELVHHVDVWTLHLDLPTLAVFGVRTNEGRYAAIQVTDVADDHVRLRYRTYADPVPSVTITGDFGCRFLGLGPAVADVDFVALADEAPAPVRAFEPRAADLETLRQLPAVARAPARTLAAEATRVGATSLASVLTPTTDFGRWGHRGTTVARSRAACFRAVATAVSAPLEYEWELAHTRLEDKTGTIQVEGGSIDYRGADGDVLCVTLHTSRPVLEFDLAVTVTDEERRVVRTARCIHWESTCRLFLPPSPPWKLYREAFKRHWGLRLVPNGRLGEAAEALRSLR